MKSAEFTDFASAAAFIAAGRKKDERSTADGWNTILYKRGVNYVLELHGTPIVEYSSTGISISIPMRNHVVADRIQRYGLADRFQLSTTGGKWSLAQAWAKMVGINEDPTIWLPIVSEVPAALYIDTATGALVTPAAPPMPTALLPMQRAAVWDPAIKKWLSTAMKKIDAGWEFNVAEWSICPLCMPVDIPGQAMLGWSGSNTHVMSHVLEGIVLPSTVVGLMAASAAGSRVLGLTIDGVGNGKIGGSAPGYNHDGTRRYLKNTLRMTLR